MFVRQRYLRLGYGDISNYEVGFILCWLLATSLIFTLIIICFLFHGYFEADA